VILYAFSRTHWVGVDVERMLPGVADEISRHFLPRSACRLAALSRAERQRAFYQAWTRMEAYAKSSGAGLDSDLRDLENFLSPALAVGSRSYRTPDQRIRDLCPRTDYVGALAGAGACKIKYWSWQANN
jgi:4'-phosphopantetheinyl transferase